MGSVDITQKKAPRIAVVLTTVFVAVTLLALGFFVCVSSTQISRLLSEQFSPWGQSPFTKEEIADMAVVGHDYTVGSHEIKEVYNELYQINAAAQDRNTATFSGAPKLPGSDAFSYDELAQSFNAASDVYVLDAEAITHLDDVFGVVQIARIVFFVIAVLAFIGILYLGSYGFRKQLSVALITAGCSIIGLLAILALWVIVDFNGFFSWFHSLFFAEGTWTFSSRSLLITMYPTEFWISMGAIWLSVTVLCCLLCIVYGILLRKPKKTRAQKVV